MNTFNNLLKKYLNNYQYNKKTMGGKKIIVKNHSIEIPLTIMNKLKLKPGDYLNIDIENKTIILSKK